MRMVCSWWASGVDGVDVFFDPLVLHLLALLVQKHKY
jgi:hypothetical protein